MERYANATAPPGQAVTHFGIHRSQIALTSKKA
jgi:hypothetical protein